MFTADDFLNLSTLLPDSRQRRSRKGRHKKRVVVFGVFDLLHAGHRAFLAQARCFGDELFCVVAPDSVVRTLKGFPPREPVEVRLDKVAALPFVTMALEGDSELGSWKVLKLLNPDVIVLGYDQDFLHKALLKHFQRAKNKPVIRKARPYKPSIYHSRYLEDRRET